MHRTIIAEVVVEGGVTVTLDTVTYYLGLEAGDPLDPGFSTKGSTASGTRVSSRRCGSNQRQRPETGGEPLRRDQGTPVGELRWRSMATRRSTSDHEGLLDEKGVEIPRNVPLKMSSSPGSSRRSRKSTTTRGTARPRSAIASRTSGRPRRKWSSTSMKAARSRSVHLVRRQRGLLGQQARRASAQGDQTRFQIYRKWGKKILSPGNTGRRIATTSGIST